MKYLLNKYVVIVRKLYLIPCEDKDLVQVMSSVASLQIQAKNSFGNF